MAAKKGEEKKASSGGNRVTISLTAENLEYLDYLAKLGTFGGARPTVARRLVENMIFQLQDRSYGQHAEDEQNRARMAGPYDSDEGDED